MATRKRDKGFEIVKKSTLVQFNREMNRALDEIDKIEKYVKVEKKKELQRIAAMKRIGMAHDKFRRSKQYKNLQKRLNA